MKKRNMKWVALTVGLVIGMAFAFQNCAPASFGTAPQETASQSSTASTPSSNTPTTTMPASPINKTSCYLDGNEIPHGNSITAYAARTYQCGTQPASETRICTNGSLSGSYPYAQASSVGGLKCPAQTLSADITAANNGSYCVQQVPQSNAGAESPFQWRFASHGSKCSAGPSDTPYLGTAYYPAASGQVCENYCRVVATCGCDGTWNVSGAVW